MFDNAANVLVGRVVDISNKLEVFINNHGSDLFAVYVTNTFIYGLTSLILWLLLVATSITVLVFSYRKYLSYEKLSVEAKNDYMRATNYDGSKQVLERAYIKLVSDSEKYAAIAVGSTLALGLSLLIGVIRAGWIFNALFNPYYGAIQELLPIITR